MLLLIKDKKGQTKRERSPPPTHSVSVNTQKRECLGVVTFGGKAAIDT